MLAGRSIFFATFELVPSQAEVLQQTGRAAAAPCRPVIITSHQNVQLHVSINETAVIEDTDGVLYPEPVSSS